jgi:hypothetical protein
MQSVPIPSACSLPAAPPVPDYHANLQTGNPDGTWDCIPCSTRPYLSIKAGEPHLQAGQDQPARHLPVLSQHWRPLRRYTPILGQARRIRMVPSDPLPMHVMGISYIVHKNVCYVAAWIPKLTVQIVN